MAKKGKDSDLPIIIFSVVLLSATAIILTRMITRSWEVTANIVAGVGVLVFCYFYWETVRKVLSKAGDAMVQALKNFPEGSYRQKVGNSSNMMGCPDCGSQISVNADSCPDCGHSFNSSRSGCGKSLLGLFAILTGIAGFCFWPLWLLTIVFVIIAVSSD